MDSQIKTKVYGARLKNREELLKSSSGGAFTAITNDFLDENNAVVSAIYNYETNQVEFQLYTDRTSRNKARGSKYIQSKPLDSYKKAEEWLKTNKGELLFVGMGCQADGFRQYAEMKGIRDRCVIVDIICHGMPSPKIWRDYIKNKKIEYVTFRDKRNGWRNPVAYIISNGNEKNIGEYSTLFYASCSLRPSCYNCRYTTTERKVDLTIGDFWGIEKSLPDFASEEGNSLILIHTQKGLDRWEKMKRQMLWEESNLDNCLQPNLISPTKKSPLRDKFWIDYKKGGIELIIKRYAHTPFWRLILQKTKSVVKRILKLIPIWCDRVH